MAWRQKYSPNVKVGGIRGWCLKWVDDAGKAPKRTANAAIAGQNEKKRLRTSNPPKGLWVPLFYSLVGAPGHVQLGKYLGDSKWEIRDSETQAGARGVYRNTGQVLAWFGAYRPKYLGWSTHCDGRQYVEEYTPKPSSKKSDTAIAKDIIANKGGWGNNPGRATKLKKHGYDPKKVQAIINKLLR